MCTTKVLQRVSNCTRGEENLLGVEIKKEDQFVTEAEFKKYWHLNAG